MKALLWLRYRLIRLLVGGMPVVMNMAYFRPVGFRGDLYHFPRPTMPGLFTGNELYTNVRHVRALMVPRRDLMPATKKALRQAAR